MSDDWTNFAVDCCDSDYGRPSGLRLALKLVVIYIVLASFCLVEMRFRQKGIELEANIEIIGEGPKGGTNVRLHFRDPITGRTRMNTVCVPDHQAPKGQTAIIEYIPGEYPTSRLKTQSRPRAVQFFFWLNVVFAITIVGLIFHVAIEANRPIPRSCDRLNGMSWQQNKSLSVNARLKSR